MELDSGARATILVHAYRAMVGRADIWRMRMDATTNWAIGATAAVVSFALGSRDTPHTVVLIASFLTVIFLLLEARRLTFYHLWQRRALLLERGLVAPAIRGGSATVDSELLSRELAPELGTTVPSMPLAKAAARRLRRVYLALFATQLVAWVVKLWIHPHDAESVAELVSRAALPGVPGEVILGLTAFAFCAALALAIARGGVSRGDDPAEDH